MQKRGTPPPSCAGWAASCVLWQHALYPRSRSTDPESPPAGSQSQEFLPDESVAQFQAIPSGASGRPFRNNVIRQSEPGSRRSAGNAEGRRVGRGCSAHSAARRETIYAFNPAEILALRSLPPLRDLCDWIAAGRRLKTGSPDVTEPETRNPKPVPGPASGVARGFSPCFCAPTRPKGAGVQRGLDSDIGAD